MKLAYLDYIMTLNIASKDGARELLQLAMLANSERLVKRRDVSARKLSKLLRQSTVTTSRHLRKLIVADILKVEHHDRVSYLRLPEPKTTTQNDD